MGTLRNSGTFGRRSILSLLLFTLAISLACAQGRTVKGKVTSQEEGPLAGVNIVLQGTLQGTMTDAGGNFSIAVPGPEAVLVFSSIGYITQGVTVGNQATLDVVLVAAVSKLNEVVVIGYGTQKRNEITSSVSNVKADEFNKGSIISPEQLIQGKVSGLSITKPGSDPNGTYDIRLRGLSTVGQNTQPLIVIDGIIGGTLENVDPNDIESMNVLKDGSAAAIYGTRGSAGVILVTTKKGKKGTTVVEYNGYVTAEMPAKFVPVMNATEWRALSKEVGKGTDYGANTDWFKEITQTGITQVHNIAMSGGSDKSTYRASFNYHDAQGIEITTGYKQLNGRLNFTQKAINDKLTLEVNVGATKKDASYGFNEAFRYATIYNPTAPVMSDDPAMNQFDHFFQEILFDYYNPVAILKQDINEGQDNLLNASLKGTFQLTRGLAIDAFYSMQSSANLRGRYYAKHDLWTGRNHNGLAQRSEDNASDQLFESTIHWTGDVASGVNITALGGYSYQDFLYEGFYNSGGDFLTDAFSYNNFGASQEFKHGLGVVTSYKNSNKLIGFVGRVILNVNDRYFVTASARYEGSSKFGSGNKWGLFPSIGGGVDISKFLSLSWLDNLKVRASYGITGQVPSDSYISLLRFGPSGSFYNNGTFLPAYAPVSNANTDLKWERKGEFDAGFDFSLSRSKLTGSFDYYTRTTTDLLWQYDVPSPPNLYTRAWLNLGKIKSSGLELTLNWAAISKPDFSYVITLTPSYSIANTLVSLSGTFNGAELKYGVQDLGDMGSPGQNNTPMVRVEEGKPIGQLLGLVYNGIDSTGTRTFVNINGDVDTLNHPIIDGKDRVIIGNGLPKFLIGWGNTFTFKNWDLNIFFRGVFGHDLVNSFRAFYEVPLEIESYNLPKTAADQRSPINGKLLNSSSGILSDYYVEKASFVTLDNLALGYSFKLPKTAVFSKIRVYLAGNNLFYITKYTGVDPNVRYRDSESGDILQPGIDRRNTWFRTRSFTFGANVVF